ncbi:hypothetical protein LNQ49_22085 [Flavobacterium sp. F-65]|uniref:Tissue inhibitor of metalloproteinase n=1 Tax=Flavobacterium pisciphilum TaxID=2893755 RepID=A0ABS8MZR9_9FLAO|nr:hypothetical protein [Flavobacterium sp. F-65]MCC9074286.1 hypothetical protein [Flavobacterium sp. F-65]
MKSTILKIIVLLIFGTTNTYAGWYKCYNYKGTIDKYPISFSIQITEEYFGEKAKKAFNINGVYKYDKHNNPIKLEGKIDFKNNKAFIYEIQNNKNTAVFEFNFSEKECNGTWTNLTTKKVLPLHLSFISKLTDTSEKHTFNNIEILQSNSLTDYYFVGIYSKKPEVDRAQMDKLKIIRKSNNSVFQTLNFSKIETQTGNVMTVIYDNVENVNLKTKTLIISNNIGRVGGYLTVEYDSKTNSFKIDPEVSIEG